MYRAVIDKWESLDDPQVTRILKDLEKIADKLSGKNKVHRFVTKVVSWKTAPEVKLKLLRHVIDRELLDKVSFKAPDKPEEYQRLDRAYHTLFKKWWGEQELHFRSLSGEARIQALTEYRSQVQDKFDFPFRLSRDFDLVVDALIQESEREKDRLPIFPAQVEPSEQSLAHGDSKMERILWLGPKNELIELFNILIRLKKIPSLQNAEKYRYIEEHFVDCNGKTFTNKNLAELERITNDTHTGRPKGIHRLEGEIKRVLSVAKEESVEN